MIDPLFIDRVKALAVKASKIDDFPVGAIVVKDGKIIGEGYNQKESLNDPTAHAEVLAIKAAVSYVGDWRLSGALLITTLEPCPMCLGAIIHARIETIIYLAKDIRWGACGSVMDFSSHDKLNHRCEVVYQPDDEVVHMMKNFFKLKRDLL
tara:strand:- start:166 stop:618 length:453 start_codon:yes stop_codon:yes gene_type:complete